MVRGLYTAFTGMTAQQRKMDIVSNNLANVSTTGFKKDGVALGTFKEVLAVKVNDPEKPGQEFIGNMASGTEFEKVYTSFEQGGFKQTDNPYDIALDGKGMITIGAPGKDGELEEFYTRDGSFSLNKNGEVVTKSGNYVLGQNGKITIAPNGDFVVNHKGEVYSKGELVDTLKLTEFEDYETLRKNGGNLYKTTSESVAVEFNGRVSQGFVENSNVNSVNEMVEMISIMRSYEANQKVLTTYDTTLEKTVNNVGRVG